MENIQDKKGLNGFQLKLIGIVLMTLDHIHYFFGGAGLNVPIWFNWLGRIVAPIFIFLTVEGFYYTKNRKKYLLRLYIGYVIMSILNKRISLAFPSINNIAIMNSMFGSLFLVVLSLCFVDLIRSSFHKKDYGKLVLGLVLLLAPFLISFLFIMNIGNLDIRLVSLVMTFLPMPLTTEGQGLYIFLGIILYMFREDRRLQVAAYVVFSLLFLRGTGLNPHKMFYENYQWLMVVAAPLLLAYNGEQGRKMKYFFYIFYPSHIYALYLLGTIIEKKII